MNSSAKFSAFSFLAAAALGAAAITGCTLSSGTVDDTDGGTWNNDKDSGTPATDGGATDSGTDGGDTLTCESKQEGEFISPECQSCLATSCCTELKTCFDIAGDDDEGLVDCNEYASCVDACGAITDAEEAADCYETCDSIATDNGVVAAYDAILSCGTTSCATVCGLADE